MTWWDTLLAAVIGTPFELVLIAVGRAWWQSRRAARARRDFDAHAARTAAPPPETTPAVVVPARLPRRPRRPAIPRQRGPQ